MLLRRGSSSNTAAKNEANEHLHWIIMLQESKNESVLKEPSVNLTSFFHLSFVYTFLEPRKHQFLH